MPAGNAIAMRSGARLGLSDRECGYFIHGTRGGELSRTGITTVYSRPELVEADAAITCSAWFLPTATAMLQMTRLPLGWDARNGCQIDRNTIQKALRWLATLLDSDTEKPSIVPTVTGGVQVEWHMGGVDIEIYFEPGEEPTVSVEDIGSRNEWDGDLYLNLARFRSFLPRLQRQVAADR
jgi:hypothetical protein